ncbi:hypothetical protein ACFE04_018074 [Oxalis oulophora]
MHINVTVVNWVEGRGKSSHASFSLSARSPALLAPPEWQLDSSLNSKSFDFTDHDFVSSSIANEIAISMIDVYSQIQLLEAFTDSERMIGEAPKNLAAVNSERTICDVKILIG